MWDQEPMEFGQGVRKGSGNRIGFDSVKSCKLSRDKRSIEVVQFSPTHRTAFVESRTVVSVVAAIASILLHAAFLTTAVWKGRTDQSSVSRVTLATVQNLRQSYATTMQMVIIDEATISQKTDDPPVFLPPPPSLSRVKIAVDLPALAVEFDANESEVDDGDESAEPFARYLAQINARIDRAWIRPPAPIGEPRFNCQARIEQDAMGNVIEVLLERCNGNPSWQLSLVHAIQSASPLPAPPDPTLFVHAIHMSFQAQADVSGVSSDGTS
jgi:TonB C terminal